MKLIGFTLASFLIILVLNVLGIRKFGFKSCLSAYGKPWAEAWPGLTFNIWSVLLMLAAFCLIPPLIQSAEGNPAQCIAFLAPLYLSLVALTPDYEDTKKKWWAHQIGAWTCVTGILCWMIFIMGMWLPLLVCLAVFVAIGLSGRNLKTSLTYYLELTMFLSAYWCLLSY